MKFFYERHVNTYFQLCRPSGLGHNYQLYPWSKRAAIDVSDTNRDSYALLKFIYKNSGGSVVRLFGFTAEVLHSIPGWGTKILASHLACPPPKHVYQKKSNSLDWPWVSLPNLVFELVSKTLAAYSY